jgi:hypothetical protein
MSNSRSFDRAADYYDKTRPLAEPAARRAFKPSWILPTAARALM